MGMNVKQSQEQLAIGRSLNSHGNCGNCRKALCLSACCFFVSLASNYDLHCKTKDACSTYHNCWGERGPCSDCNNLMYIYQSLVVWKHEVCCQLHRGVARHYSEIEMS